MSTVDNLLEVPDPVEQRVILSGPSGQLIDGTGAQAIRDAAVVIEGDRIVYAGPRAGAVWAVRCGGD